MLCIGLTGVIASGKSTISALFTDLGIDVISADQISKELTTPGQLAYQSILQHFGSSVQKKSGEIDRKILRHIIFKDAQQRLWLEKLLHPLIRQRIEETLKTCHSPYCLIEIPLLTDPSHYPYLNRILTIITTPKLQQQRLMQRDQHSSEEASTLINVQKEKTLPPHLADDVLVNKGSLEELNIQVKKLHEKYIQESSKY